VPNNLTFAAVFSCFQRFLGNPRQISAALFSKIFQPFSGVFQQISSKFQKSFFAFSQIFPKSLFIF
jgi:hypothetical protein